MPGEEENVAFPLPKGLWESDLEAAQDAGKTQERKEPFDESLSNKPSGS